MPATGPDASGPATRASHAVRLAARATEAAPSVSAVRNVRVGGMPSPPRAPHRGRARPSSGRRRHRSARSAPAAPRGGAATAGRPAHRSRDQGTTTSSGEPRRSQGRDRGRADRTARDRPLVEKRRHRDHERFRRQRARRDDVDVLPRVAELDPGLEEGVDQAVALHEAAARFEPAEHTAERDHPDPVAALEVAAGERRGRAHGALERPSASSLRTSAKQSRKRTTSALRSGCLSLTISSPRRALARQLTDRSRSPGTKPRVSANSSPSALDATHELPARAASRAALRGSAEARGAGRSQRVGPTERPSQTSMPMRPRARTRRSPSSYGAPAVAAKGQGHRPLLPGSQAHPERVVAVDDREPPRDRRLSSRRSIVVLALTSITALISSPSRARS